MPVAAAQPISPSSALIQGTLSIVDGTDSFIDGFADLLGQAILEALNFARTDLRLTAGSLEGWKDVLQDLDVEFDGEGFVYFVSNPESVAKVNLLEYGDQDHAPTGLLRKTALRQAPLIGVMVERRLSKGVPSA